MYRKYNRIHSDNRTINKPISNELISSASAHQYYQNQRPVNYYNTTVSTPRSHAQNYQNRRKYLSSKFSLTYKNVYTVECFCIAFKSPNSYLFFLYCFPLLFALIYCYEIMLE